MARPAARAATVRPRKVERFRLMSGERDVEGLSVGMEGDGLPIQDDLGRRRNSRDRERAGHVGSVLSRLESVADFPFAGPRTVLDPQQADLAVGPQMRP